MDVVDGVETVIVVEDEITVDVDNVAAAVMTLMLQEKHQII